MQVRLTENMLCIHIIYIHPIFPLKRTHIKSINESIMMMLKSINVEVCMGSSIQSSSVPWHIDQPHGCEQEKSNNSKRRWMDASPFRQLFQRFFRLFPTSLCGVLVFGCVLSSASSLLTHHLLTHATYPHTTYSHTQLTHTPLTHTPLTHTQLTHTHTHTQLTHTPLTHTQLTHTHSHTTYPHTTYSHTTCSHTSTNMVVSQIRGTPRR